MKVFKSVDSLQTHLKTILFEKSLGFVPTMGALHDGHLSIIERAHKENDIVIATIFVNPTQFDNPDDLKKYPNQLKQDLELLKNKSCDLVFIPTIAEMYHNQIESEPFDFDGLEKVMEGAFRKGHFDGVATIVKKFFHIIEPQKAYFGEKDFQQLQIIKKLVEKLNLNIEIIACDIFREKDGLAMSSRNSRLSNIHRTEAPLIFKTLLKCKENFNILALKEIKNTVKNEFEMNPYLNLEYFEIAETTSLLAAENKDNSKKYRAFISVFAGSIRLIDNIALN